MRTVTIPVAFMPLVDAAPLIIAQEMGFAEAEGIALDLIAAPSWSSLRDMLAFGRVDRPSPKKKQKAAVSAIFELASR